jgi:nitrogen-specific signal transduction histidine kinase
MRVCQFRHDGKKITGTRLYFFEAAFQERTTSNILQVESTLSNSASDMEDSIKPADVTSDLRGLAHDLSNSLETILHAAYLLQDAKLNDQDKKWALMIDNAARDAARINREIRKILNSQS